MGKQLTGATAGGDSPLQKANIDGYKGKLFVIEPLAKEEHIVTDFDADATAVRANIWVVRSKDGTKFETFEDVLIFQRVLQGQLRKAMGTSVVFGRLGQKPPSKPSHSPAWILADPTPSDTEAASAFWSARSLSAASTAKSDEGSGDDDGFADDDGDSF